MLWREEFPCHCLNNRAPQFKSSINTSEDDCFSFSHFNNTIHLNLFHVCGANAAGIESNSPTEKKKIICFMKQNGFVSHAQCVFLETKTKKREKLNEDEPIEQYDRNIILSHLFIFSFALQMWIVLTCILYMHSISHSIFPCGITTFFFSEQISLLAMMREWKNNWELCNKQQEAKFNRNEKSFFFLSFVFFSEHHQQWMRDWHTVMRQSSFCGDRIFTSKQMK